MIPGPPPVMIAKPCSPSCRAQLAAPLVRGWSRGVRAEPKIETALPTWRSAAKPAAARPGCAHALRVGTR
jgi:hypothetical protein